MTRASDLRGLAPEQRGRADGRGRSHDPERLDVERLTTVLYDWMPDGADVSLGGYHGDSIHLSGGDLARFIFDRAAEYDQVSGA